MNKSTIYSQYKLIKHLDSLMSWEETGETLPHAVDFNLTNKCNNKCPLCFDIGRSETDNTTMELSLVKHTVRQFKNVDIRTVVLGGGGDPVCHPNLSEIIRFIKSTGIQIGISTNGHEMCDEVIDTIGSCCSFARVSLDADGPEIYKRTHGMGEEVFMGVIGSIKKLVSAKRQHNNGDLVVGVCYLLGEHTMKGVYNATRMVKELGVDTIRIRPFYNWGNARKPSETKLNCIIREIERCVNLGDKEFFVSATTDRLELMSEEGYYT